MGTQIDAYGIHSIENGAINIDVAETRNSAGPNGPYFLNFSLPAIRASILRNGVVTASAPIARFHGAADLQVVAT